MYGTVISSIPSTLDTGLLDVTITNEALEPRPTGTRDVLDLWSTGQPATLSLWTGYDRVLRREWAGVSLAHRRQDTFDQPPGTAFHLDGRFVTDVEGFNCAIGEAINDPSGYFGSSLDALDDCLCGGWGAAAPLGLVWQNSAVARHHLVVGHNRHRHAPAVTLHALLEMLTAHRIEVDLR